MRNATVAWLQACINRTLEAADAIDPDWNEDRWEQFLHLVDEQGRFLMGWPSASWLSDMLPLIEDASAALQIAKVQIVEATDVLLAASHPPADAPVETVLVTEPVAVIEEAAPLPVEEAPRVEAAAPVEDTPAEPAPTLTCDVCGRTFAKRNALTMHVRSHQPGMMTNAVANAAAAESSAVHTVADRIREREATSAQNERTDETFETFEERRVRFARERVAAARASY